MAELLKESQRLIARLGIIRLIPKIIQSRGDFPNEGPIPLKFQAFRFSKPQLASKPGMEHQGVKIMNLKDPWKKIDLQPLADQ
ncbi:MAG: hypothetical protein ABI353_09175 [Isosphaeraceae bacterium]